jgi:hypothetical protein
MKLSDCFRQNETDELTHNWILVSHDHNLAPIESLAECLADKIMEDRCIGCPHHYEAWKQRSLRGTPLSSTSYEALSRGFIKPVFGLPNQDFSSEHLQGAVSQYLWYFLVLESSAESIERIERSGFAATDHGGDGMAIHRVPDGYLMFRLWEIKKSTGNSPVSASVNTAYEQLKTRATEYLARYTTIGQELPNTELAEFYGKLIDLWIEARPEASVGVAVSTNVDNVPSTCFTTFGDQFPRLTNPKRLKGMLTAIDDFLAFSEKVQRAVWKGL